jgi:hypothetical protein
VEGLEFVKGTKKKASKPKSKDEPKKEKEAS